MNLAEGPFAVPHALISSHTSSWTVVEPSCRAKPTALSENWGSCVTIVCYRAMCWPEIASIKRAGSFGSWTRDGSVDQADIYRSDLWAFCYRGCVQRHDRPEENMRLVHTSIKSANKGANSGHEEAAYVGVTLHFLLFLIGAITCLLLPRVCISPSVLALR